MTHVISARIASTLFIVSMIFSLTACISGGVSSGSQAAGVIGVSGSVGTPAGEHSLLGIAAVSASSHDVNRARVPELAIDGDPETKWTTLSMPQWFTADLGDSYWLSRLRMNIFVQRNGANAGYSIDVSPDNLSWTTILENESPAAIDGWVDVELTPVTARYVRLRLDSSDESEYTNLSQFELYGRLQPTRIVEVTASSFDESNGRFPELAIDGDLDTKWTALNMPQWLTLDLGATHQISGMRLNAYISKSGINASYSIDISVDNVNWTTMLADSSMSMTPDWTEVSFDPVEGRYLRLRLDSTNRGDYVNLNEIEVYARAIPVLPTVDLSLLSISAVSASSYDVSRARVPELAIDGDLDTKWTALSMPQWFTADLGAAQLVSQLRMNLFVQRNGANASYDIDVSMDNDSWTTVMNNASPTAIDGWVEASFEPVTARYVRVRMKSGNSEEYINLSEFELYGQVLTTATIAGVTATSFDEANGRFPEFAIDGDLDTKWTALSLPQSLTLDLGAARFISGSRLYTYISRAGINASYSIDVSMDNAAWTTVLAGASLSMSPVWTEARFNQIEGRYVRFRLDSTNPGEYVNLSSVEVYVQASSGNISPPPPVPGDPVSPPPVQDISNIPLTLTWKESSGNVLGYKVYFGTSAGSISTELTDIPNSLSSGFNPANPSLEVDSWFTLRLLPGDNACFNLRAYNSDGLSNRTSPVCIAITEAL